MRRRLLVLTLLVLLGLTVAAAAALVHDRRGFHAPVFAPDGRSVFLVIRDVRAVVLGFGYEGFTPPASVWLLRDRLHLARIHLADGRVEFLQELPPTPLEGTRLSTYRGGLYGSADAHLRWHGDELDYEVQVRRPNRPTSTTFVLRSRWTAGPAPAGPLAWSRGARRMTGAEPAQLSGSLEVLAVGGGEPMPCAVVLLSTGPEPTRGLAETAACRSRHADGYDVTSVHEQSVRAMLERRALLASTHAELLADARRRGLSEGDAALEAIRGMQRLGLYPKPTQLVAAPAADRRSGTMPIVDITDEEFRVGLFSDIQRALEHPGEPVDKHPGPYLVHDDFSTSRQLNEYLAAGETTFLVRARGRLWRLTIERP